MPIPTQADLHCLPGAIKTPPLPAGPALLLRMINSLTNYYGSALAFESVINGGKGR